MTSGIHTASRYPRSRILFDVTSIFPVLSRSYRILSLEHGKWKILRSTSMNILRYSWKHGMYLVHLWRGQHGNDASYKIQLDHFLRHILRSEAKRCRCGPSTGRVIGCHRHLVRSILVEWVSLTWGCPTEDNDDDCQSDNSIDDLAHWKKTLKLPAGPFLESLAWDVFWLVGRCLFTVGPNKIRSKIAFSLGKCASSHM